MKVFSTILNLVTWPASLVRFQVSSIIKCYRHHENQSHATVENAIKLLNVSPNSRTIFTSSEYHVTWTRFENAAVFLSKTMFELLYILQNSLFSPHCAIFLLIMQSDAARGQLCEIAPARNIRSPV